MTEQAAIFRTDIQGLRAIAVLFVIIYHVWPHALPGGFVGVDVFFVVSGFLITGLLLNELESKGRISLGAFYARRMKRLLPAATLVLVAVALSSVALLPSTRWKSTAYEVIASALYAENWLLLRTAVDYWAQGGAHSPVMHYWSLSIEEQFYLVWPGLLALSAVVASHLRARLVPSCCVLVGLVFVASFAYSVHYSEENGAAAYFSSLSRAWELALGALTCLALRLTKSPSAGVLGSVLGWLALAAVLLSGFVIDDTSTFPGTIALLPTLATAALLLTGARSGANSPTALLQARPLQVVGDLSYSLYLWHWPLVVLFHARADRAPRPGEAAVLLLAMLLLAHATKRLVEDPIRVSQLGKARPGATFALGAACMLATAAAAALPLQRVAAAPPLAFAVSAPGARALAEGALASSTSSGIVPAPIRAKDDLPALFARGCHLKANVEQALPCELGPEGAARRIALVGDSHAFQWVPALAEIADAHGLKVISITKTSCPLTDAALLVGTRSKRPYAECERWNRAVRALLRQLAPELVLTSQASGYEVVGAGSLAESARRIAEGSRRAWRELADAGIPVLVIRDTPAMGSDIPDCVARQSSVLDACAVGRALALPADDPVLAAARSTHGVFLADLGDFICTRERCPAVVGGVLVYRDEHHLTATYARTLAPMLWTHVQRALERAP